MSGNNQYLLPFKRGAFEALLPVIPMVFKYGGTLVQPVTGYLHIMEGTVLLMSCNLVNYQHRIEMPTFIPNDYMFETFKDKGRNKAEVFAWAVREAMHAASGIPKADKTSFALKSEIVDTIKGKKRKTKSE